MSRYETLKPSGIDWLGDVPKHWEVKRLKNIVLNDIGGLWGEEPADDENDIIVLRVADFDRLKARIIDNSEFTYRNIKPSQLDGRLIKQGDILLEKSGGGEQQPVGKAVLFDKEFKAVTSNFINKIETLPNINNHFALYLFDALYYNNINVRNIKQTTGIQNLDNTSFFGEKISLPPKSEQFNIANYLDNQTQKIDRLIANKKAQAEKLKELRQIEINNAVTKGLNPNAEMKDSGIDWLGKIPKHWEVKRVKDYGRVLGGFAFKSNAFLEEGNVMALKITNIQTMQLVWDDIEFLPDNYFETYSEYSLKTGDLVFALTRPIISTGIKAAIVSILDSDRILINQRTGVFKPSKGIETNYLYFIALSDYFFQDFNLRIKTTNQPNISTEDIARIKLAVPPKAEQIQIANYLEQRTSAIDQLIKNIEAQIEKLQELRKIKIYEAVTGKIKVNAYAETTA